MTDQLFDKIRLLEGKLDYVEHEIVCAIGNLQLNDSKQQRANALYHIKRALTRIQDEKQEPEPPEVKWLEKGFWICPRLCRGLLENLTAGHA